MLRLIRIWYLEKPFTSPLYTPVVGDQNLVLEQIFKNAYCDQIWYLKKIEYHLLGMIRVLENSIKI